MRTLLAIALLAGCGGDDGGGNAMIDAAGSGSGSDAAVPVDAPPSTDAFTLTSPTITEGGAIPLTHVCSGRGGMNLSPELAFANVPAGTMSFAVVLTDLSLQNGFVHSAIYDIPGTATGLPADVDKVYAPPDVPGAHQTLSYQMAIRGYNGPCPPVADGPHMYQFKVYALATSTLPSATMNTTKDQVVTTASASNLGTATLTGMFDP
jgi:Raf kinase inhibitor-like YbhB/YbcL family protein